jgi:hypothetical protein
MFTIGREREKEHAKQYIRDASNYSAIGAVIDAVHDCLDGTDDSTNVREAFRHAFLESGSGVWEQTGTWLGKLTKVRPEYSDLWEEFAESTKASVRFRVAACLNDMPSEVGVRLLDRFSRDPSKKIRIKVAGDLWVQPRDGTIDTLKGWLEREHDAKIQDEIRLAIENQQLQNKRVLDNRLQTPSSND